MEVIKMKDKIYYDCVHRKMCRYPLCRKATCPDLLIVPPCSECKWQTQIGIGSDWPCEGCRVDRFEPKEENQVN